MSSSKLKAILATALILSATGIAFAHHTYVTKYHPSKKVTISGVVTSVSFFNPHVFFSVQTAKGTWTVESESISVTKSKGLTQNVLKVGARVTVTGWPARNGTARMGLNTINIHGGPTIKMRRTAR